MKYMVWLPLLANLVVAVGAPALARRLPYRVKPLALTVLALIAAVCWTWCLALLAASFLIRRPTVAAWLGVIPGPGLLGQSPPAAAGAAAAALVAGALVMLLIVASRSGRDFLRAERMVRVAPTGRVLVLADRTPDAYAVGGLTGGRVAITTGMIDCLDRRERQIVLAHERAHLAGRHHWLRTTVACAAAVDPLLRRFPELVEVACERWADERAAGGTEARRVLARALGKAALATLRAGREAPGPPPTTSCALHHHAVSERMVALLDERPRPAPAPVAAITATTAALVSAMIAAAVHAGTDWFTLLR